MELFRFRNVALGCAGFIVALYFSYFRLNTVSRLVILIISILVAALTAVIYLATKKRAVLDKLIKYLPLCFFIALSMLVSLAAFSRGENILKYTGSEREITAEVVLETWENDYGGTYVIEIKEIDGDKIKCKAVLEAYDAPLDIGNTIILRGKIYELSDKKYGFSEKSAYLESGISAKVSCEEINVIDGEIKETGLFKRVNKFLDLRFEKSLNSDTYALFSALLLGNKNNLDPSVRRDFARLGISHVLALSGMHITLLTTLFSLLLSFFKTPKPIRLVLLIFTVVFFVGITGFSDSAVRAGLMTVFYFAFRLIGKGADSVTSLFLSVTLILTVLPYHIFSVSLILSFLSMLGCIAASKIITYAKIREKVKKRLPRYIIYTLITSFVVLGFTSAVVLYYFGEISLFSPVSNIVLVPIFTGFIYFAPFLLLFCTVPYVSVPFVLLAEHSTKAIEEITGALSRLRGISLPIYGFWQCAGLIGFFAVLLVAMIVRRKYLFKALSFISLFLVFFLIGTTSNVVEKQRSTYVSAFNYEDSDYLILENDGKISILDFSKSRKGHKSIATQLPSSFGFAEVEDYVLFNYSTTSAEYVRSIISWDIVRVLYLPQPRGEDEASICAEIMALAKKQGTRVEILSDSLTLFGTEFEINRTDFDRSVYDSVSVSGKINGTSILYLGSSSYESFDYFGEVNAPNADIVIFGDSGPTYKLEYNYPLKCVDYAIFICNSYDFASEIIKNATQGKEFLLNNDYVRIKILSD